MTTSTVVAACEYVEPAPGTARIGDEALVLMSGAQLGAPSSLLVISSEGGKPTARWERRERLGKFHIAVLQNVRVPRYLLEGALNVLHEKTHICT